MRPLLTGIIVTRAQLSQTLQPVLSWSGSVGGSRMREGLELLALGPRAFELLSVLDIRVQVTDSLGDVYERDLQCIRPRPAPSPSPG
ncbi:hypothetical protein ACFRR7_32680 [Streptomyces sp. NPDC056909]|uniref:hypothetical protein n=1 Tax=Streptomyces sp. NPDC056909 TaxID=3345963 RepID=UPI0036C5025A